MKILLSLFTLFLFNISHSEELEIIQGNKSLPTELNLIYQSYQSPIPEINNFQKLLKHSFLLEPLINIVSKEELFFIVKSETYKTILKFGENTKTLINPDDLKKIQKASLMAKDPFIKWLLTSLANDYSAVFRSKFYKDFILQKSSGSLTTPEAKKIFKKVQILSKLHVLFNLENPENNKELLFPIFNEILKNIENSLFLIISESKFDSIPKPLLEKNQLKVFKIVPFVAKVDKTNEKSKSVEDIIDGPETLEEEAQQSPSAAVLPAPSKENWIEEQSSPIDLKKLPKPTDDADWLQDF